MSDLEQPAIEGVVVEGYHPATYRDTCLTCGRSALSPGCSDVTEYAPRWVVGMDQEGDK